MRLFSTGVLVACLVLPLHAAKAEELTSIVNICSQGPRTNSGLEAAIVDAGWERWERGSQATTTLMSNFSIYDSLHASLENQGFYRVDTLLLAATIWGGHDNVYISRTSNTVVMVGNYSGFGPGFRTGGGCTILSVGGEEAETIYFKTDNFPGNRSIESLVENRSQHFMLGYVPGLQQAIRLNEEAFESMTGTEFTLGYVFWVRP